MPKMTAALVAQIFKQKEDEIRNFRLDSDGLDKLKYNPEYSYQENYDAMMWLFRPSAITKSQIEKIVSLSDPHFRCSSDSARRAISHKFLDFRVTDQLRRSKIMADDAAAHGGVMALSGSGTGNQNRLHIFLRTDGSAEADEFNQRFLDAYRSGTPEQRGQVIYEEFNRLRQELGAMEPEDLYPLLSLSDADLLDKIHHIYNFCAIMAESKEFGGAQLTEKQYEHISLFRAVGTGLQGIMRTRIAQITNPTYEFIGPEILRTRNLELSVAASDDILEGYDFSAKGDGRKASAQPIHQFLTDSQFISNMTGEMVHEAVCAKDPRLNSATWSVEGSTPDKLSSSIYDNVSAYRPVMARLRSGEMKVVSSPYDTEAKSLEQYLGALSAIADKSNRFLFTGSKQFDDMDAAMKNMLRYAKGGANMSGDELENMMNTLQQRAQEYLEYKGYKNKNKDRADGFDPENLPKSKNSREQSRIELAATLINLTRAHAKVREKTKEMDKKLAEQKEAAKKKASESAKNGKPFTLTDVENFRKNANNKLHFVPKERVENPQFQLGADTGAGLSDFAILALFGAASPDTQYKLKMSKDSPEYTEIVNNPDKAYPELLTNILFRNTLKYDRTAVASASGLTQRCKHDALKAINAADGGDFQQLGKLVANGLKQNTKLLNSQKAINNNFIAYAEINTKALEMMERNPALKEAVTNNMTPEELNAAKAAAAMAKVHLEGLKSFDTISKTGFYLNANHEKDIVNVFQMYYVDNQFASKEIPLEQNPYGSQPDLSEKINELLLKGINTTAIMSSHSEDIQSFLNNRNELSKICVTIITDSQKKPVSNSAPQVEKQINKEAEANKANEGKVIG